MDAAWSEKTIVLRSWVVALVGLACAARAYVRVPSSNYYPIIRPWLTAADRQDVFNKETSHERHHDSPQPTLRHFA